MEGKVNQFLDHPLTMATPRRQGDRWWAPTPTHARDRVRDAERQLARMDTRIEFKREWLATKGAILEGARDRLRKQSVRRAKIARHLFAHFRSIGAWIRRMPRYSRAEDAFSSLRRLNAFHESWAVAESKTMRAYKKMCHVRDVLCRFNRFLERLVAERGALERHVARQRHRKHEATLVATMSCNAQSVCAVEEYFAAQEQLGAAGANDVFRNAVRGWALSAIAKPSLRFPGTDPESFFALPPHRTVPLEKPCTSCGVEMGKIYCRECGTLLCTPCADGEHEDDCKSWMRAQSIRCGVPL